MSELPTVASLPEAVRRPPHVRTLSPVLAHLRTPLHRDGYALVLNSAVTAVIGLAYWMLAARSYSANVVGVNAALISTMMFLAGISQLNFSNVLVRFVPDAGRGVRRLVVLAYAASLAVAGVVASCFVAGVGIWARGLESVTSTPGFGIAFVAATMGWCVFVLQDSVLTGLGRAVWVPVENGVFSAVKLVLLLAFAAAAPVYGIFASWTAALVASLIPVNVIIFSRLIPAAVQSAVRETVSVTRRELVRYVVADYAGAVSWLAATTLPPIIVTAVSGAAANAYFSLGWVIAFPIYFVPASLGSSLVVHAVREPEMFHEYARKAFVQGCRIVVPCAVGLALAGPFLLRLLGREYAEQSVTVLRLVALAGIPNVVNVLYISVARVERRMSRVVVSLASQCAITLGLAVPLLHLYGITGVGVAWFLGQLLVAVPIVLMRTSAFRPGSRGSRAARAELVRAALDALPSEGGSPPPASWVVRRRLGCDRDLLVAAVGPRGGFPEAVVKVADGPAAARQLAHEHAVLRELHAIERLGNWRRLVPQPLAGGSDGPHAYLAVTMLPGVEARDALRLRGEATATRTAAEAIAPLARRTAESALVEDEQLSRWVGEPLAVIGGTACLAARPRLREALCRVDDELRSALAGRRLATAWGHGDYWLGNILVSRDGGEPTAIVDWERARAHEIAVLDTVHLLVTTRALVRGRELGTIVRELAAGARWSADEERLLDALREDLGDDHVPARQLVLLAWARHVAGNLSTRAAYAGHRLWLRKNVVAVLDSFAA